MPIKNQLWSQLFLFSSKDIYSYNFYLFLADVVEQDDEKLFFYMVNKYHKINLFNDTIKDLLYKNSILNKNFEIFKFLIEKDYSINKNKKRDYYFTKSCEVYGLICMMIQHNMDDFFEYYVNSEIFNENAILENDVINTLTPLCWAVMNRFIPYLNYIKNNKLTFLLFKEQAYNVESVYDTVANLDDENILFMEEFFEIKKG